MGDVALPAALEKAALGPGAALLSTPVAFTVAALDGVRALTAEGLTPLEPVFEARCFDGLTELRWLQTGGGRGTAVLLSDEEGRACLLGRCQSLPVVSVLDAYYLLWGRTTPASVGGPWAVLEDGRIGALTVPLGASAAGRRARLRSVEYLGRGWHGNVSVAEERLVRFEEYDEEVGR